MSAVVAQVAGLVGLAAVILGYQCKDNRKLLFMQLIADLCYVVQFFILGGYTGSISLIIASISLIIQCFHGQEWADWRGWRWVFNGAYTVAAVFTWQGPLSLLPLVASITSNMAYWSRNGKIIRVTRLAVISPAWLVYDFITGSWSGVACQVFSVSSVLISIRRHGLKNLDVVD